MPAISPYPNRGLTPGFRSLVSPNFGTLGDARGRTLFQFCPTPTSVILAAGELLPFAQSKMTLQLGPNTLLSVPKVPGPVLSSAQQPAVTTAAVAQTQAALSAPKWGA